MGKIGKDNLESLLAVSEITGRLSKDVKEIVFSLAHLYGDRDKEGVLTAGKRSHCCTTRRLDRHWHLR